MHKSFFGSIIIIIAAFIVNASAIDIQLLCLNNGQSVKFSECNNLMQDRTCNGGGCQYCVTFDSQTGVYCPANINACNVIQDLTCSGLTNNTGTGNEENNGQNNNIVPKVVKADIAYVVKDQSGVDNYLLDELKNNGYSYEILFEAGISKTNFDDYFLIMVGNQNLNNPETIPVDRYKSLIINSYDYYKSSAGPQLGWSGSVSTVSSPTSLTIADSANPIAAGVPRVFRAYNSAIGSVKTSVLKGQKPVGLETAVYSGIISNAVVASVYPGMNYLNGKIAKERAVFFGITRAQYWTLDSKRLFKNSLNWLIQGADLDGDGFLSDVDCNDRDPKINPAAEDPAFDCFNDPPVLKKIPSLSFSKGDLVLIKVEATDPENEKLNYKIDDQRFSFSDNDKTFKWQTKLSDAGDYTFKITVSDGEKSISQDVIVKIRKSLFKFNEISNLTWEEDGFYEINLRDYLSNPENDNIIFGVGATSSNNNIILDSNPAGRFKFTSKSDWFGEDWIIFSASNGDENVISNRVNLKVTPIDDAPRIKSASPDSDFLKIANGQKKTFSLNVDNVDNDAVSIKWYVNNVFEAEGSSYVLNKQNGFYILTGVASDSINSVQKLWSILVADSNEFTCSEIGGFICSESQICSSSAATLDNPSCCMVQCAAKPPQFKDFKNCNVFNESLSVKIGSPDVGDTLKLGDTLRPEIEVESSLNEDLDLDLDVSLYDITEDRSIVDDRSNIELKEGRREITRFEFDIPEDLDLSNDYVLLVIAKDGICNQEYMNLNIERPENKVGITEFDFPEKAECGDSIHSKIKIKNFGSNDQDVALSIKNNKLNINENFPTIELEEFDKDDSETKDFTFDLSKEIEAGEYIVTATVRNNLLNFVETKKIQIECEIEKPLIEANDLDSLDAVQLNNKNTNGESIESSEGGVNLLVISIMLLATFVALGFLFFVYSLTKNKQNYKLENTNKVA